MSEEIDYGSICSGIEAASLAWECLNFKPRWFAEIEPFPSAVLAHRWPAVPNLGDMTKLAREVLQRNIVAPLILVGGTPCQAFSVAGMRAGLDDPRGALTIKYVELADAVDHVRPTGDECVIVWENVPGVLSDKGNAFGCFLGALVGESDALLPAGGKWTNAGCVYGPKRAAAWRVLDAQYFGLAQRRRRVFVVASARNGFDPAAVLFEREGVRRDTAPRRGEGQDVAGRAPFGPALQCGCGYLFDESLGEYGCPACEGDEGPAVSVIAGVPAFGGENQSGSLFQAGALTAHGVRNDYASETFCVHGTQDPCVNVDQAHALGRNSGRGQPIVTCDVVGTMSACGATAKKHGFGWGQQDWESGYCQPHSSAVRRLTPTECERLQGFPDNYTLIPWRGKPADECPDGPRYKAIGNSKAVPVVRWIGRRIKQQLEQQA